MNRFNLTEPVVIGVDHGYGNIKTARTCFQTGVTAHDQEPIFKSNLLVYDDRYYTVGDGHKEFAADKIQDTDFYILTLAVVARELRIMGLASARVHLAAGLPLTWVSGQKDVFKAYLLQNDAVDFTFRGRPYHVEFAGADIFPQGFSAVANQLHKFRGVNMLSDIGNGTMNIMYINNGRPVPSKCFTEKYGTHQCMLAARERLMRKFGTSVDDAIIEEVLRYGTADIDARYLDIIRQSAADYVSGIMRRLREHEYDVGLMKLYVMGGGSCLIQNFSQYDPERVEINKDIHATAKGYEALAKHKRGSEGVV